MEREIGKTQNSEELKPEAMVTAQFDAGYLVAEGKADLVEEHAEDGSVKTRKIVAKDGTLLYYEDVAGIHKYNSSFGGN